MERDEIHARIEALKSELDEKVAELDELIAKLGDDRGGGRRPRLRIVKGGLGALALPITALGRRPRHPVGAAAAFAVAGAAAAVMLVPGHTTPGGPGAVISYVSVPAPVLWHAAASSTATWTPNHPGSPSAAATPTGIPTAVAITQAASGSPASSRSPSAGPTTPRGPRSSTPAPPPTSAAPPPTPTPSCLIVIDISSILRVCANL